METINWRAKALKDQQISSMVESLGTLLRATLSSKKPLVTLDYEIGLAGSYMTIQKYALRTGFCSMWSVPKSWEKPYTAPYHPAPSGKCHTLRHGGNDGYL
ncbi:MAG: sensor histidine kinase [Enterocloster clostridioformis]